MSLSLPAILEALLFASGEATNKIQIIALLEISPEMLSLATSELRHALLGRGLALIETDGELEIRTSPDASIVVKKLRESELSRDLGKASLEVLAIILYQRDATRGEIDFIRGVNSGSAIRALTLRGLIDRSDDASDKRRARYRGTLDALGHLGVTRVEELPRFIEFSKELGERVSTPTENETVVEREGSTKFHETT